MKRSTLSLALVFLVLAYAPVQAEDIIDRIMATVNGHLILQSDWEDEIAYEKFMAGQPLDKIMPQDRKAALDRLINQELLSEQVKFLEVPTGDSQLVQQRIQEIRKLHPGADTLTGWQAALRRYGLKEKELEARIAQQLELTRLVEARLRPGVQIDSSTVEIYYQEQLLPRLRQAGAQPVPLADVTPKIKEVLTQQKLNDLLASWLQSLRSESQIRTPTTPSPLAGSELQ
jgi:peptidyl-prolyl cis-trans isomerase SurA